jgi:hypothetical protein
MIVGCICSDEGFGGWGVEDMIKRISEIQFMQSFFSIPVKIPYGMV